jgi:hypothetical protein
VSEASLDRILIMNRIWFLKKALIF